MLDPELKTLCDRSYATGKRLSDLQDKFADGRQRRETIKALNNILATGLVVVGIGSMFKEDVNFLNVSSLIAGLILFYLESLRRQKVEEKQQELSKYHNLYWKELPSLLEARANRLYYDKVAKLTRDMILVDWKGKPAVVFSGSHAYAVLKPQGDWMEVDGTGVLNTGKIIPDAETFDQMFEEQYGFKGGIQRFPSKIVIEHMSSTYAYEDYLDGLFERGR